MTKAPSELQGFNPEYHFQPGTTVEFANRIDTGNCYSFEPGEELRCRRCGGKRTKRISPPAGPTRCNDGALAADAAISRCMECGWGYIWRICAD